MRLLFAGLAATLALTTAPAHAEGPPACAGVTGRYVDSGKTCAFQYAGGGVVYVAQNARAYDGGAIREDEVTFRLYSALTGNTVAYCQSIGIEATCSGTRMPVYPLAPGDWVYCTVTSFNAASTHYYCGSRGV